MVMHMAAIEIEPSLPVAGHSAPVEVADVLLRPVLQNDREVGGDPGAERHVRVGVETWQVRHLRLKIILAEDLRVQDKGRTSGFPSGLSLGSG